MSVRRISTLALLLAFQFALFSQEAAPKPQSTTPAHPIALPAGPSKAGWEAFVKNDFPAAETAFKKTLEAQPNDIDALEGLRWTYVSLARYRDAQTINLRMLDAAKDTPLGSLFAQRATDALGFVESRAEVLAAFEKWAPSAAPVVAAYLRDEVAFLHSQAGRFDEARKAIENNGYVGRWIFAAGPFGEKDKSNVIERRFAPERALTSLDFKDENGKPVKVVKDPINLDRDLDLDSIFRDSGGQGVFYVMANLNSDVERDIILIVVADAPNRVYLHGMPIASEPDDDRFHRNGGQLYRVRLAKGDNPLLLKLGVLKPLIVRVCGDDYGPIAGVKTAPLSEKALAEHTVSTTRGMLFAEKTVGSTAAFLLKRLTKNDDGKLDEDEMKAADSKRRLHAIADHGALTLTESVWLEMTLQRENDPIAREVLARRMFGTFGDSVGVLDIAASVLGAAGATQGNNDARESEDARRLREHALKLVPNNQQHMISLADFFRTHGLNDQAFELVKKCAESNPESAFAQADLGREYVRKKFYIEAEKCFERAAKLDNAQLRHLAEFHDYFGVRSKGREIHEKMRALGMMNQDELFADALAHDNYAEAERLLNIQAKWQPERRDDFEERRAQLAVNKGDLEGAFAIRKALYAAQFGRTGKPAQPSALVDLAVRLGKLDEAKALLSGYLAKHPNDFEIRRRLRDLTVSDEKHWWSDYDVNVADIDTSHFDNAHYASANHAWIVDFMVTKITPDLSRESYVHIAQKVLNLKGIGELSEVLVRAQKEDIVFIRTLNPDGSAYMPQNVHNFNLSQTASLYKVGPGSILEHAYLEHLDADEDEPVFSMGFNFNALDAPRAVSRWVVMIPDELKDKLEITRIRPELLDEKILPGPKGFTTYQWTNKQIEGIKAERFMPREVDQEIIPLVQIQTRDNPLRAGGFMLRRQRDRIPEEAKAKARELAGSVRMLAAAKGRVESAIFEAIVFWVRDNIDLGNDSRTIDDVWFAKKGTGPQLQELACEMARGAGLNVHNAGLNGSYLPGRVWHTKNAKKIWEPTQLASFGSGGSMLVLEPTFGNDRWAQFPGGGQRPRFFSPFDLTSFQPGALAMITGDEGLRIKRVLGDRNGLTLFKQNVKVALDAKGSATTTNNLQLYGLQAGAVREAMNDPRQKEQLRESLSRRMWPKQKLTSFVAVNETDTEKPLGFTFAGQIDSLAEPAGGAFYLSAFPDLPRLLGLRGSSNRESDVIVYDDNSYSEFDRSIEYHAPEGHAWTEVPEDIFLVTDFGFYAADYNVSGRVLYCTRSFLVPAQRITPEKYADLQHFLKQIAEHASQRVAYAPYDAKAFGGRVKEIFSQGYASSGDEKTAARK